MEATPVPGHDAALGELQPKGKGDIAALALSDDAKGGYVTGVVQEGVELNGAFGRMEPGLREQAQAERDGGAVQGKEWMFEAGAMSWRDRLTAGVECEKKSMVQCRRATVVGLSQCGTLGWCQAEGSQRSGLGAIQWTTYRRLWRPARWAKTRAPNWLHRLRTRLRRPVPSSLSNDSMGDLGVILNPWARMVLPGAMARILLLVEGVRENTILPKGKALRALPHSFRTAVIRNFYGQASSILRNSN